MNVLAEPFIAVSPAEAEGLAPVVVLRVPDVGNVTFVAPVVVKVRAFAPDVVNAAAVEIFPPSVIVFELETPVPPRAAASVPVETLPALSEVNAAPLPVNVPAVMSLVTLIAVPAEVNVCIPVHVGTIA